MIRAVPDILENLVQPHHESCGRDVLTEISARTIVTLSENPEFPQDLIRQISEILVNDQRGYARLQNVLRRQDS